MSLTIDTGITARMPTPNTNRGLPAARKGADSKGPEDPALKVSLKDTMAQDAQDAAASTYNVTSLKALRQGFYKASLG